MVSRNICERKKKGRCEVRAPFFSFKLIEVLLAFFGGAFLCWLLRHWTPPHFSRAGEIPAVPLQLSHK
jgi:hypothetical protein